MTMHIVSEETEALKSLLMSSCSNLEDIFKQFEGTKITQFGYVSEASSFCADLIRVIATNTDGEVIESHISEQLTTPYGYPSILVTYTGGCCNDLMTLQGITVKRVLSKSSFSVKDQLTGNIHLSSQWELSNGHYVTFNAVVVMG